MHTLASATSPLAQVKSFRLAGALIACAVVPLLLSRPSHATPTTLALGGTNWQIGYDTTQVTGVSFAPSTSDRGTLSFTEAFGTLSPISIAFTQVTRSAASNFGLRLFFNETVQNNTGTTMSGFGLSLVDPTTPSPQGSAAHPGYAHFHPTVASATGQVFPSFSAGGTTAAIDAAAVINLTGGTLAPGASTTWTNFGAHDWEDAGLLRDFTLVETPTGTAVPPGTVPEPGTLALLVAGLGGLFLARRQSMRR